MILMDFYFGICVWKFSKLALSIVLACVLCIFGVKIADIFSVNSVCVCVCVFCIASTENKEFDALYSGSISYDTGKQLANSSSLASDVLRI